MAVSRSTNTMSEALRGLLGDISDMKTFPDADIEWLLGIETQILAKLREPVQQAINGSDMSGMGQPPGMGAGMPGPGPAAPAPGVPGLRTSPAAPNPDELRRLLTQGQ